MKNHTLIELSLLIAIQAFTNSYAENNPVSETLINNEECVDFLNKLTDKYKKQVPILKQKINMLNNIEKKYNEYSVNIEPVPDYYQKATEKHHAHAEYLKALIKNFEHQIPYLEEITEFYKEEAKKNTVVVVSEESSDEEPKEETATLQTDENNGETVEQENPNTINENLPEQDKINPNKTPAPDSSDGNSINSRDTNIDPAENPANNSRKKKNISSSKKKITKNKSTASETEKVHVSKIKHSKNSESETNVPETKSSKTETNISENEQSETVKISKKEVKQKIKDIFDLNNKIFEKAAAVANKNMQKEILKDAGKIRKSLNGLEAKYKDNEATSDDVINCFESVKNSAYHIIKTKVKIPFERVKTNQTDIEGISKSIINITNDILSNIS